MKAIGGLFKRISTHGGTVLPPDDAFSSAPPSTGGDEHPTQLPPAADICPQTGAEKDAGGGLGGLLS